MLARAAYQESTIWVELRYEAEVGTEITTDGMLRLPSFKGLL
jgi:hypothetical protein